MEPARAVGEVVECAIRVIGGPDAHVAEFLEAVMPGNKVPPTDIGKWRNGQKKPSAWELAVLLAVITDRSLQELTDLLRAVVVIRPTDESVEDLVAHVKGLMPKGPAMPRRRRRRQTVGERIDRLEGKGKK